MRMPRKRKRSFIRGYATVIFQLLAVTYLLFCIAFYLTSPTSARFTDTEKVKGTLSAAADFGNNKEESDKNSKNERKNEQPAETKDKKLKPEGKKSSATEDQKLKHKNQNHTAADHQKGKNSSEQNKANKAGKHTKEPTKTREESNPSSEQARDFKGKNAEESDHHSIFPPKSDVDNGK